MNWTLAAHPAAPGDLAGRLGISPRLADLLYSRGLTEAADMAAFLNPGLRRLAHPDAWPGVRQAAELLAQALAEGRRLAVWGDYDVDGLTGTALVAQVMRHYGLPLECHIPDRRTEGYGLSVAGLERLAAAGAQALLTVDCGISDAAAVQRAKELGLLVIVSDHHLLPETLPPADVICNPRLGDCPCRSLAGVGVAFFVMSALNNLLAERGGVRFDMRETLDLVALGTLADMVPLEGQNRILVKNGLLKIAEAKRPGIAELKVVSGFQALAALGAGQVVFSLAPRINAAGRMGDPGVALELLRTDNHDRAADLAAMLDASNAERRREEDRIFAEALEQAQSQQDPALVLYGPSWHQGIIGIVASRLVEACRRPVVILCLDNGTLKGSGRSVKDFNLYEGLGRCADLLLGYGGHSMAAGLRLAPERLPDFRQRLAEVTRETLGDAVPEPALTLDGELDFAGASDFVFLKELEMLQPFGIGNREPVFASPPLEVKRRRLFGPRRNHVELTLRDESTGVTLNAKAWKQADTLALREGQRVRLAYSPSIDTYNGVANVDVRMRDIQMLEDKTIRPAGRETQGS